jgi:hypothetical protein
MRLPLLLWLHRIHPHSHTLLSDDGYPPGAVETPRITFLVTTLALSVVAFKSTVKVCFHVHSMGASVGVWWA